MQSEVIFQEKHGRLGPENVYVKPADQNTVVRLEYSPGSPQLPTNYNTVLNVFRDAFLPQGYPDSVSDDYLSYQIWDTIQAFCSTITGTLTTQAIMKGVGVGDNTATALAATITWILKDGTGMVGRILFAWWKGISLDADCKKWRLVADILNDAAMFLELCIPYMLEFSTGILCVTSSMKSIVGVAGGATRAAITQHQAIRNNMGDVSAKDGSQETFVNLLASLTGILILTTIADVFMWPLFILFTTLHMYSNYRAVKSLKMVTLNTSRLLLLLRKFLVEDTASTPEDINEQEAVIVGCGLSDKDICGFNITMGKSLKHIMKSHLLPFEDVKFLLKLYQSRTYMHILDMRNKKIHIIFQRNETAEDVLEAYFHAVLYGITIYLTSFENLSICCGERKGSSCIDQLKTAVSSNTGLSLHPCVQDKVLIAIDELEHSLFKNFLNAVQSKGWKTDVHQLNVDEWRCKWELP